MALKAISTPAAFNAAIRQRQAWNRVTLNRQHPIADGVNTITAVSGSNTMNNRIACWTPRDASVTDIVLGFPGFYEALPEASMTTNFTVTASIEYPAGTIRQVFYQGGTTCTVTAGRQVFYFDPAPVIIPANTLFWVKTFMSWTGGLVAFPLVSGGVSGTSGEWCNVGTALADNTLTTTVFAATYGAPPFLQSSGYTPAILGTISAPVPSLGILGDSIYQGLGNGDIIDSVYGGIGFERAMRNVVPVSNVARFAETAANYITRPDGRAAMLDDSVTNVLFGYGRNDLDGAASAVTMRARMLAILQPYMARGVRCYVATVTPRTTSTDGFITAVNQTVANAGFEAQRVLYNTDIRTNWQSYGLSGVFDFGRVVDPTDSGKWNVDGTAGRQGYGVPTMAGTAIASVARPVLSAGAAYGGQGYPLSNPSLACVVTRHADDPIRTGDATITCATDGTGTITGFTVVAGGSYGIPPLISAVGTWTHDGTHPTTRAYNAMFAGANFAPNAFT